MKRSVITCAAIAALTLSACGAGATAGDLETSDEGTEDVMLMVFAAASLQASFDEIADDFSQEHPDVSIELNYAGSSTLVQNLEAGAPADVFASANEANMDLAQESDLVAAETRELFASNQLVGIVPADNPAEVTTLEEATADNVNLVVCAPQVPCGALSQTLADAADVTLNPVSEEQQVSDVLGKVRSGQADAGLVYATDAALAPDEVEVFDVEGADAELNYYPIARTANSEHADIADEFIAYVHSDAGQAILEAHGFTAP